MSGRALVSFGDVNSGAFWGGHPYFFLQAGRRNGLFQAGVEGAMAVFVVAGSRAWYLIRRPGHGPSAF